MKEHKRSIWMSAIKRKDFNPKSYTVICSQHFGGVVGGNYSGSVLNGCKISAYVSCMWLRLLRMYTASVFAEA